MVMIEQTHGPFESLGSSS